MIESGELVCAAVYLSPLDSTDFRGNPPKDEDAKEVTMALHTVLQPQLDMTIPQYESAFTNRFFS